MKRRPSKPVYRVRSGPWHEEVRDGVVMGLYFATAFSLFVLIMAVFRGSMVYDDMGGLRTWQIVVFYYSAGVVGGTVHGLLAPLRERYVGKLLNAYVLLYLVYGGGTVAFWPMLSRDDDPSDPLPLGTMLLVWAVLCLILAPVYVKVMDD